VLIDAVTDTVDSTLVVTWNFPLNIRNQSCLKFLTFSVAVKSVCLSPYYFTSMDRAPQQIGAGLTAFGKNTSHVLGRLS